MKILESEWSPTLTRMAVANLLVKTAGVRSDHEDSDYSTENEIKTEDNRSQIGSSDRVNVDLYRFFADKGSPRKKMSYFKSPQEMELKFPPI